MELKDTIEMMTSEDYKERFKAEYYQVKIRKEKLRKMICDFNTKKLNFTPTCPLELYYKQGYSMQEYLDFLRIRAKMEDIELDD